MAIIGFSGAKCVPCFTKTAAVHAKQPRSPVKGTGAVFSSLHGACQERGDLRSRAGGGGVEAAAAHAGGHAVLHGPGHRARVIVFWTPSSFKYSVSFPE